MRSLTQSPNRPTRLGRHSKLTALAASAAALSAWSLIASTSVAAAPSAANPAGHISGVIPARGQTHVSNSFFSGNNLSYHNGPVMLTNKVYAIYWAPGGNGIAAGYDTVINKFFADLAAAQNSTTNVYGIDSQYYNSARQHIANSSSVGGSYLDTQGLPQSGCSDAGLPCLTDAQLQSEIQNDVAINHWTVNSSSFFVLLTGEGIGSCFDSSSSSCAFTQYCAYHGAIGSGSSALMYANMPYADTDPSACDAGESPNANPAADAEINLLSHEHNETITDPQLNAWYDRRGNEIGDKCAWNFGTLSGSTGAEYNQTINSDHYFMQQEWSNKISGCAQHA